MDRDDHAMARLAEGDSSALEELVTRHQVGAWKIAAGMLGDPVEAEDMVQLGFLRVLEEAHRYRPQGRFRAWFRTLVARLCLQDLRRRRPTPVDGQLEALADPRPGDSWALGGDSRDLHRVRTAILALPDRQRMAIVLRYDAGCGYAEIAQALGDEATSKSVERLLERARRTLLGLLGPTPGSSTRE